jgi:hypothetical protein
MLMRTKKSLALAAAFAGLFGSGSVALACEPILDILLFSDESPGKCPVPTTVPQKQIHLCFGGECRSFGGTDKGQFGQLKKDAPGILDALVLVLNGPGGNRQVVVQASENEQCPILDPQSPDIDRCDALYKIKGLRPVGAGLNSPLCTFDNLTDVNAMTQGPGVTITDVNGQPCASVSKPQFWLYYKICCEPGSVFGAQGSSVDIDLALLIDNGGACQLDPVREERPEVIPSSDSPSCE